MKLLLDTQAFLWWDTAPEKLSPRALALCRSTENQLLLSVISVWEIQIKHQLGKLTLTKPLPDLIAEQKQINHIEILSVHLPHVLMVDALPTLHKDPFDRLLIAQAIAEDIPFITSDAQIAQYPLQIEW